MCGPHQVWPLRSECCGRGVPTKVVCAECMKMCCLGGKNSVVKGLIVLMGATCTAYIFMLKVFALDCIHVQNVAAFLQSDSTVFIHVCSSCICVWRQNV